MNNNFLNVHDTLELILFVHSQVKKTTTNIDISHGLYNFIKFTDLQHLLKDNNLIGKYIYNNNYLKKKRDFIFKMLTIFMSSYVFVDILVIVVKVDPLILIKKDGALGDTR